MTLVLTESVRDGMRKHAESAFPSECCGLMLGRDAPDGAREVSVFVAAENAAPRVDTARRYHISPGDLMRAAEIAEDAGLDVVGVYHSHPDGSANYSEFDLERSLPLWSYLIMECSPSGVFGALSWRRSESGERMDSEELLVVSDEPERSHRDNVKAAATSGIEGGGPSAAPPKPMAPPPPPDETAPFFRVMSRMATDRALRRSKGTAAAFGRSPLGAVPSGGGYAPYQAPGMRSTLGGM